MKYLVRMDLIDPGPLLSPQQVAGILENLVVPSFQALVKLEKDGKILAGGLEAGARSGVFIVDAPSHDELSRLLESLPFWGIIKWQVTPLESFEHRIEGVQEAIKHLKAGAK